MAVSIIYRFLISCGAIGFPQSSRPSFQGASDRIPAFAGMSGKVKQMSTAITRLRLFPSVSVLALAVLLAACGSDGPEGQRGTGQPTREQTGGASVVAFSRIPIRCDGERERQHSRARAGERSSRRTSLRRAHAKRARQSRMPRRQCLRVNLY